MAVGVEVGISESILHNFAKRLANNEPKQRRIALKKLRLWLKTKSSNDSRSCFSLKYFNQNMMCVYVSQ